MNFLKVNQKLVKIRDYEPRNLIKIRYGLIEFDDKTIYQGEIQSDGSMSGFGVVKEPFMQETIRIGLFHKSKLILEFNNLGNPEVEIKESNQNIEF